MIKGLSIPLRLSVNRHGIFKPLKISGNFFNTSAYKRYEQQNKEGENYDAHTR